MIERVSAASTGAGVPPHKPHFVFLTLYDAPVRRWLSSRRAPARMTAPLGAPTPA